MGQGAQGLSSSFLSGSAIIVIIDLKAAIKMVIGVMNFIIMMMIACVVVVAGGVRKGKSPCSNDLHTRLSSALRGGSPSFHLTLKIKTLLPFFSTSPPRKKARGIKSSSAAEAHGCNFPMTHIYIMSP